MCTNMKELQAVSEKIFELEQKKAKKQKEVETLEKKIKQLKSETSSYMKQRRKNELTVAGLTILFTKYERPFFNKDAFIEGEKDGAELYDKYSRKVSVERVTVRLAKN